MSISLRSSPISFPFPGGDIEQASKQAHMAWAKKWREVGREGLGRKSPAVNHFTWLPRLSACRFAAYALYRLITIEREVLKYGLSREKVYIFLEHVLCIFYLFSNAAKLFPMITISRISYLFLLFLQRLP